MRVYGRPFALSPKSSSELDWQQSSRPTLAAVAGRGRPFQMAPQCQAFLFDGHYLTTLGVDLPERGLSLEDLRGSEFLQHFIGRGFELARESLSSQAEGTLTHVEGSRGWDG